MNERQHERCINEEKKQGKRMKKNDKIKKRNKHGTVEFKVLDNGKH